VRLVHTHPGGEDLTRDDLADLKRLRLDLCAAITLTPEGEPAEVRIAHLVAQDGSGDDWKILPWTRLDQVRGVDRLVADLEADLARRSVPQKRARAGVEGAILVHVSGLKQHEVDSRMEELAELASSAGVEVLDTIVQRRPHPDPKYVIGKGKVEELNHLAMQNGAGMLIFDHNLSPAQVRSLGAATELKVIDRSQLILDIFAQRARTRDGKLQVELAQLRYALPRLGEKDDALSRLTGGIGGRGPGETKLEVSKRRARERVHRLEKQVKELARQREVRRARRQDRSVPVVAIVGYTNAGKSTLLNTLTGATVDAEDKLFATLDPTSRRIHVPGGRELVFTDTVGFLRDLPKDLVAAFKATLEELRDADVLLHVVDAADPEYELKTVAVEKLLGELELGTIPRVLLHNKIDLLNPEEVRDRAARAGALPISARLKSVLAPLLERIDVALRQPPVVAAEPEA
jgi:GTP-binding protein HflX